MTGGLAALAAESALLMPATDWLEYPESLLTSKFGCLPGRVPLPISSGLDRLVRMFDLPGEGSGVRVSIETPLLLVCPSSEK
jgi:hypothetical protein